MWSSFEKDNSRNVSWNGFVIYDYPDLKKKIYIYMDRYIDR